MTYPEQLPPPTAQLIELAFTANAARTVYEADRQSGVIGISTRAAAIGAKAAAFEQVDIDKSAQVHIATLEELGHTIEHVERLPDDQLKQQGIDILLSVAEANDPDK